jgi:predicted AlkP superfamily pyrophosphatase or phosphodiesterase
MKKIFLLSLVLLMLLSATAQKAKRPKLVVGVVVDQMRWDYLYRYQDRYGSDGFMRMLREGFTCESAFISYTPTYTAAGHSSVYTGSVPALNGIPGNYWYSREKKRNVYCTEDDSVRTVGSASAAGKMSPANLWSSTITDELRMAENFRGKTIAIALKDRGAILPGGHTANAAYWFDNANGSFITSSFYMEQLPAWVQQFNARRLPDQYLSQNWNTLYPINTYSQSTADQKSYESKLPGEDNSFPHITESITQNKYESFRHTPYGNTITFEMARAAVENERLGKSSGGTDFLAVSFSSTDYVGHMFGPNSIEVEDMYLRFDKELGAFLKYLDGAVGKGQYLLFLTADHGAAHIPGFARENRMPGGAIDDALIKRQLNDSLRQYFKSDLIEQVINYQVYLNHDLITRNNLNTEQVKSFITARLLKYPGIGAVYDLPSLKSSPIPAQLQMMLSNGYNQKLSGDLQFIFKPQWFDGWNTGTTHGTWNPYDSHIPLLWFGWNIKPGQLTREVYMSDIAPTIAAMLKVQMPNASIGKVIEEVGR